MKARSYRFPISRLGLRIRILAILPIRCSEMSGIFLTKLFVSSFVLSLLFLLAKAYTISDSEFVSNNNSKLENKCPYEFCQEHSWPDPRILQSYQVYGSAIALDNQNNVVVLHRSFSMKKASGMKGTETSSVVDLLIENDVIMILDSITGELLRTWGGGRKFARPHGIEVIEDGSVFITDVLLHQVFRFDFNATLGSWNDVPSLILGEKFISGNDPSHFCGPADVAVLPTTKDFFVADGYCNSRVIKFNELGTYVVEFHAGSVNSPFPHIPFNVTHAVRVALPEPCTIPESSHNISSFAHERSPIIFVADRNNARIQSFTENGSFLYEIGYENFVHSKEMLFGFDFVSRTCGSDYNSVYYYGRLFTVNGHLPRGESRIFEIDVGYSKYQVVNSFPASQESRAAYQSSLEIPHDICASSSGEFLYIIEALDELILKKFVKNREYNTPLTNSADKKARLNKSGILQTLLFIALVKETASLMFGAEL